MRHEFTKATKREAAMRCRGNCEKCGIKLPSGGFHYDHINPDWFSGDNHLDNCQVLCIRCHKEKTSTKDQPAIAKTKRILDKERGIRTKSSFACSKDSKWKQKLNGQVVPR